MNPKVEKWVIQIIPAILFYFIFFKPVFLAIKMGNSPAISLMDIVSLMWPILWAIGVQKYYKLKEKNEASEVAIYKKISEFRDEQRQDLTSAITSVQSGYKHGDLSLANELSEQKNEMAALEIAFEDFQIVALVSNEFRALTAVNGDYSGIRYSDPEARDKNFRTNQILECNYILKKLNGLYPKVSVEENRNCIAKYFGISPEDF